MKHVKGSHEVYVIMDVFPDPDPSPWLASDEVWDLEMFWDGIQWSQRVEEALTWETFAEAAKVADAVRRTRKHNGEVCIKVACLETTIEVLRRVFE